ncbi:hypothetical protein [Actinomadura rudentiformis]|uniref:hypothetical protein n=1 Tax=Actinomadura rudentiformis TaxID=359158 RepID=UPI00178C5455|nr:hypothetical protein [Actinomadura rudentiformis]
MTADPDTSKKLSSFVRFASATEQIHQNLFTETNPRQRAELMHTAGTEVCLVLDR